MHPTHFPPSGLFLAIQSKPPDFTPPHLTPPPHTRPTHPPNTPHTLTPTPHPRCTLQVFDPKSLPKEDFLDALQREWAAEEERRKAARAAGHGRVEFHKSGGCRPRGSPAPSRGSRRPAVVCTAGWLAAGQQLGLGDGAACSSCLPATGLLCRC